MGLKVAPPDVIPYYGPVEGIRNEGLWPNGGSVSYHRMRIVGGCALVAYWGCILTPECAQLSPSDPTNF